VDLIGIGLGIAGAFDRGTKKGLSHSWHLHRHGRLPSQRGSGPDRACHAQVSLRARFIPGSRSARNSLKLSALWRGNACDTGPCTKCSIICLMRIRDLGAAQPVEPR
jgi:hypothetical protein